MPKKPPLYPHVPKSRVGKRDEGVKLLYCKECGKEYATWRGLEGHFISTRHKGIGSLLVSEELLAKMHPEYANSERKHNPLKRQDVRIELRGWEKGEFGFAAFDKTTGEQIADIDLPEHGGISEEEALDYLAAIDLIER